MINEMTKKAAKLANDVYLANNKPKAPSKPVVKEPKAKRVRVNVKDLHELPARLELVNSNMQLVSLLAKSEAKSKKIFADAQAQLKAVKGDLLESRRSRASFLAKTEKLIETNQQLVLEEAQGALELEEGRARERAIAALLEESKLAHRRERGSYVKQLATVRAERDKLVVIQQKHDRAMKDWRIFLLFVGFFVAACSVLACLFR